MGRTKPLLLYHPYPRHRPCVKVALRRGCHGETPEKRSSDTKCLVPIECETLVSRENHRNEIEQASPFIYLTDSRREIQGDSDAHWESCQRDCCGCCLWMSTSFGARQVAQRNETAPCQFFAPLYPCLAATPPHGSHWVRRIPTGSL